MKTNVSIELSDEQLIRLADLIDHKRTKRKAKRQEINDVVHACMELLLREPESRDLSKGNTSPSQGNDWFDEYLMETCGAVFGGN